MFSLEITTLTLPINYSSFYLVSACFILPFYHLLIFSIDVSFLFNQLEDGIDNDTLDVKQQVSESQNVGTTEQSSTIQVLPMDSSQPNASSSSSSGSGGEEARVQSQVGSGTDEHPMDVMKQLLAAITIQNTTMTKMDATMTKMDATMTKMDITMTKMNETMTNMNVNMTAGFTELGKKMDNLKTDMIIAVKSQPLL